MKLCSLILLMCLTSFLAGADATVYHRDLIGELMANQKPYDPKLMTCAHGNIHQRPYQYPLGTKLKVSYQYQIGLWRSVIVEITDRHGGLTDIDLSFVAFYHLCERHNDRLIGIRIEEVK